MRGAASSGLLRGPARPQIERNDFMVKHGRNGDFNLSTRSAETKGLVGDQKLRPPGRGFLRQA
jgi:hypothetical protein